MAAGPLQGRSLNLKLIVIHYTRTKDGDLIGTLEGRIIVDKDDDRLSTGAWDAPRGETFGLAASSSRHGHLSRPSAE